MGEFLQPNHSFVKDDTEIHSFSRRDLFIIFVGGIVSASLGLLLASPVGSSYDFAPLLFSANTVSMVFATGLFSFLVAGLLFSSRSSRLYFLSKIDEVGAMRAFLIRILHVLVITSLFMFFFTVVVFLYPVLLAVLAYYPVTLNHFVFFPAVLGASLIGSVLLALIASSLAVFTDDSRLCVVLGCASTLLIAFIAGWNSALSYNYWHYSLTRNLAFLSPHNIVRALAIQLSGHQFESANNMVEYVGFAFSAESLTIALLFLGIVSIVLLIVAQRVLPKNSTRWTILVGMIPTHELWNASASNEKLLKTTQVRRRLRIQRGLTTMVIGVLLVSMMIGSSTYATFLSDNTRFVLYATPGTSEVIPVGSWNVFDVDVQPPYPGLFNSLTFSFSMVDWGNASDSLSFYLGILDMSFTEFNSLDEDSRLALFPHPFLNRTHGGNLGFGVGETLEESYGSYICVMLIIADANPSETSYVEASLLIIQEGM